MWVLRISFVFYSLCCCIDAVARFEPSAVTDTSLVIKMIKASNVSYFDMTVQIYDLDRLIEYRKTELRGSTKDQLFSFDGLTNGTWFAFRILYQIYYEQALTSSPPLSTKQEIIVRTKNNSRADPAKFEDTVAFLDDLFLTKDNIYIGVGSVFKNTKKVITVIVPELRCAKGVLKPLSQQVVHHANFHFDLTQLGDTEKSCTKICIFPYIRVSITNRTSETFRAKEWCGTIDDAKKVVTKSTSTNFNAFTLTVTSIMTVYFIRILL